MQDFRKILVDIFGYQEYEAELTSRDLMQMEDRYKTYFMEHCNEDELSNDLAYKEYSVKGLMSDFHMKFPAAVLFLSVMEKDYEKCCNMLKYGIK